MLQFYEKPEERGQMLANAAEIDEAVYGADQVILRDMILKREFVEQRALCDLPRSHHASTSQS